MANWIVNTYGYPNPFSSLPRSQEAWEIFELFLETDDYAEVKLKWHTLKGTNKSGLESRKLAYEEFGMLYVITGSGKVVITPAGRQMVEAWQNADHAQFIWVGMNALLRYPLTGPPMPRPSKGGAAQRQSKLLLYAVMLAVIKDLGYIWREEFDHVLSQAFTSSSVEEAVSNIRRLRSRDETLANFPIDNEDVTHSNMMTQLIGHCSMNYDLIVSDNSEVFYKNRGRELKYFINPKWMDLVDKALGGVALAGGCFVDKSFVSRMPSSPGFATEEEYFDYLGAEVSAPSEKAAVFSTADIGGSFVPVLIEGKDYTLIDANTIRGTVEQFCQIPVRQRLIASHNTTRTFSVETKVRDSNHIILTLRQTKPLTLTSAITDILDDF